MGLNGNAEIFRKRREHFIRAIGEGAVAILPSAPTAIRSNDVEFIYRQDNDFYYLTGFAEPESVALFAPGHPDGEFVMFVLPRDKERETWTGRRAGVEGAMMRLRRRQGLHHRGIRARHPALPRQGRAAALSAGAQRENEREGPAAGAYMRRRCGRGPAPARPTILDPRELIHEIATAQGAGRARADAACGGDFRAGASARDARGARRHDGVGGRGADRFHLPQKRRGGSQLSFDCRVGRQRRGAALHHQRSPDADRRSAAHRRRMRVSVLRLGCDAHLPGRREVLRRCSDHSTNSCSMRS